MFVMKKIILIVLLIAHFYLTFYVFSLLPSILNWYVMPTILIGFILLAFNLLFTLNKIFK